MKKHVLQNPSIVAVKNKLFETANYTKLEKNDNKGISWNTNVWSFERVILEVSNFQYCSTQICQNWLEAHKNEVFCHEKIQQYKRIAIVLEEIVKLSEETKTKILCQQLKKLEISEKIGNIVLNCLEIEPNQLIPTANFVNDLGVDSLEQLELVLAIEESLSIKISDEIARTLLTVQQLIDYVVSTILKNDRLSAQE